MNEILICPQCGKEQYIHEPDDISAYSCLEVCEHCGELIFYAVDVTREYSAWMGEEGDEDE